VSFKKHSRRNFDGTITAWLNFKIIAAMFFLLKKGKPYS